MRGWVTGFLLLFISATAIPQCNFQLEYSGPFRASYFDLAIDGNDLWAATGYGLQLFDRSVDPPRLIASGAIPGSTRVVRAAAGIAYAGSGSSIFVIRKSGSALQIVRSVSAGGVVNDLALLPDTLYAATSNGIASFALREATNPEGGLTQAQTSVRNVLAIAVAGSDLYAADGDNSVEVFTRTATLAPRAPLAGLPRSSSVEVVGSRIYVSDGIRTLVYQSGIGVSLAEVPFGTTTVVDAGGGLHYVAGTGRQFHAIDTTTIGQPVELFRGEIVPTGGNVNRVGAMLLANDRLYVAGGDTGLLVYDVRAFDPPYAMRSHPTGAATSIAATATSVYVAEPGGGISELVRSGESLTHSRRWSSSQTHRVHDVASGFLLTSSGSVATWWSVNATVPAPVTTVTFPSGVNGAFFQGTTAYALLADGALYSADLALQNPPPTRVTTPGGALAFAARSSRGLAVAEITAEGNTIVHFVGGASPASVTITGSATALAMDEARVAVYTFRGISVVDFSQNPPVAAVLPASNTGLIDDMTLRGNRLVDLSRNEVRLWDLTSGQVQRRFKLPEDGSAVDLPADSGYAVVATGSGVVSLNLTTQSQQPLLSAAVGANDYYKKAIATRDRIYLFDGQQVDIYETFSSAPHLIASVATPGVIDFGASDSMLFTLGNAGAVNAYTSDGALIRSATLNEGNDAVPSTIVAVAGAPWVSLTRNCLTTGCERKTVVFDPQSLVPTATLTGGIVSVASSANRAWSITEQPNELRAYDITDPLHPMQTASRAAEGNASTLAVSGGSVYALGERLYIYSEGLAKTGEQLTALQTVGKIVIDGGCAVVAGRSEGAEMYAVQGFSQQQGISLPANMRSLVVQNGRVVILTDYSMEIWSRTVSRPARRRVAR